MTDTNGVASVYLNKLVSAIGVLDCESIDRASELILQAWSDGKQIITLGNGGSSLTALHMINDWNKSIFMETRKPFRGRSLVDNIGLLMAYANDVSFQDVFIEQLENIMQPGDLVIAISGSGNSENVIRAIEYANDNGAVTLGLSGYSGGKLKNIVQHSVWVPINDMQIVEDIHMTFGHIVMKKLCGLLK